MKKILFFCLLLPFTSVHALGCEKPCNPEPDPSACAGIWSAADAAFKSASATMSVDVDELNQKISNLGKTYRECTAKARKKITDEEKRGVTTDDEKTIKTITCEYEETYNKPVTEKQATISGLRKELYDGPGKDLECASKAYNVALNIQLGKDTDSFDLKTNLRASDTSGEIYLDIVDDVEDETNILNKVLKLLTQVLGTFAVLMLIIGAYYMITSQGDESQLQKGKNIFFYTVIGLLIAFTSYIAVQFVISLIFTTTA